VGDFVMSSMSLLIGYCSYHDGYEFLLTLVGCNSCINTSPSIGGSA